MAASSNSRAKSLKILQKSGNVVKTKRTDEIFKRCCDVQNMADLTVIVVAQYFM